MQNKSFYLLNLYYPSLKAAQSQVEHAKHIVSAAAGKEWRVVGFGEQVCSLAFVTDHEKSDLRNKLKSLAQEKFSYLLVEISAIVAGTMTEATMKWWMFHLPQGYEK